MCINLGPDRGRRKPHIVRTIVIAKTLLYNDYYVVYGGADVGLLGILSRAALGFSGRIECGEPKTIPVPSARSGPARLIAARDGAERERRLIELSDEFISHPGGYGSPGEARALLAYALTDRHRRPLAFFALDDYPRHLAIMLSRAVCEGLVREEDKGLLVFETNVNNPGRSKTWNRYIKF